MPTPSGSGSQTGETSGYGARLLAMVRKATAGEYEIRGEIGRGGMAAVYLAYDLRLNRKVAVKVMLPELALHEGMEDRFRREARTAAKLDHPNIVVIYSVRDDAELLYFVMKFIEGASLEQLVRKYAPLPLSVAQYVLVQLANALQYAHDEGVVHRDVKPANVLLDRRGNALVTDFGIAKATESPTLTRTGSVIGTPAYMSPEQCMGNEQTHASDQYALGVVAYELIAGRPPFVGPSVELQWAHVKTPPPPLIDARPDCPPALADAVMRMLAKDPAERWPSLQATLPTLAAGLVPGDESPRAKLAELVRVVAPVRTDAIAITPASPIPRGRGATPATPVTPVTSIALTPTQAQLEVGESTQLNIVPQPTPAPHTPIPSPAWTSSATSIATVSPGGVVTAVSPGSAIVSAQVGSAAASATIAVRPATVASVRVNPLARALEVGTSTRMSCVVRDARDRDIVGREVDWASSNPRIASITSAGEVTAHAIGKTTIGATCDAISATVTIEVVPEIVTGVTVTPATLTLHERGSDKLSVRASDARGKAIGGRQVLLRSADPAIVVVGADGVVTAKSVGRTRIDATIDGHSASVDVVVKPAAVAAIAVSPQTPSAFAGDSIALAAALRDAVGHPLTGRTVRWASSDERVLQVDASGRATARAPGVAEVSAECDGVRSVVRVTVAAAPIARLEVVAGESSLRVGKRLRLSATAYDKAGRESGAQQVGWRSSNTAVATISPDGVVTAVAPGEVTLFAVVADHEARAVIIVTPAPAGRRVPLAVPIGGGVLVAVIAGALLLSGDDTDGGVRPAVDTVAKQAAPTPTPQPIAPTPAPIPQTPAAETTATPAPPPPAAEPARVAAIRVASSNPLVLETGQTGRIIARATTADGDAISSPNVRWRSADPAIATVSATGVVTARDAGRTAITGTADDATARVEVVVNRAGPASIAITPNGASVRAGEQTALSARVRDRAGLAMTAPITWRSSNPGIASVDNAGAVRGVRPGEAIISATTGSVTDSARITVTQVVAANPPVQENPSPTPPRPSEEPRPATPSGGTASAAEVDAALIAAARTIGERFSRGQLGPVTATGPFSKFIREDQPQLVGQPQVQQRSATGGRAEGDVTMPLRWRTFTGSVKTGSVVLRITLEQQGGTWRPTAARNLNVP